MTDIKPQIDLSTLEQGDMVIGHTIYRPSVTRIGEVIENNGKLIIELDDNQIFSDEFIVKFIRNHRKGSQEARDIVAMLRREYRKEVHDYIFTGCGFKRPEDNSAIKSAYKRWEQSTQYFLYEKAKSMLK